MLMTQHNALNRLIWRALSDHNERVRWRAIMVREVGFSRNYPSLRARGIGLDDSAFPYPLNGTKWESMLTRNLTNHEAKLRFYRALFVSGTLLAVPFSCRSLAEVWLRIADMALKNSWKAQGSKRCPSRDHSTLQNVNPPCVPPAQNPNALCLRLVKAPQGLYQVSTKRAMRVPPRFDGRLACPTSLTRGAASAAH